MSLLADNYKKITDEIIAHHLPMPTVVAASKTRDIAQIRELAGIGIRYVGENKAQELLSKYTPIAGLEWHFIGQLQTNKVAQIISQISLIHSVDRDKLAQEIDKCAARINKIQHVLVEVNLGEIAKGGVSLDKTEELCYNTVRLDNVYLRGLMAVMPINAGLQLYQQVHTLYCKLQKKYPTMDTLSMGMSNDYITAISCGANMIRLGTVLFGERQYTLGEIK